MWIKFSASVPESAASTSDYTPDFERWAIRLGRSATWRGKHSPSRVWVKRLKRGGWMTRLSGSAICSSYPWTSFQESTSSPADILASLLAPLKREKGSSTLVICGPACSRQSELFDRGSSSSKTSQGIYRWGCSTSCPIWKRAVTERRGAVTRRRLSELHTDGNECSSSGWPTPDCTMRPHEGNVRLLRKGVEQGMSKAEADAMLGRDIGKPQGKLAAWPTPTVTANQTAPSMRKHPGCRAYWPTPVAGDSEKQPTDGLHDRVIGKGPTSHPGQLNPDWVEMLMGYPIGWTDCAPLEIA